MILALLLTWSGIGSCCSRPARGITWNTVELIDKTQQIVLVDAVSTPSGGIRLEIAEFVKGGPPLRLPNLARLSRRPPLPHTDFDSHTHSLFWEEAVGRPYVWLPGACHPSWGFSPGRRYLIFSDFDSLNHSKAAELIRHGFDSWLNYVRDRISAKLPTWRSSGPRACVSVSPCTS